MEFEIKAKIWDMTDGETIKIMYHDKVFVLEEKVQIPQVQPPVVKETIEVKADVTEIKPTIEEKTYTDLGEIVGYYGSQAIHKNVLDDIKESFDKNKSDDKILTILKKWFPETKLSTKKVYLSVYRGYLSKSKYSRKSDVLAMISGVSINPKVVSNILSAMKKGISINDAIKKQFPNISKNSVLKYAYGYRKYINTMRKPPKKKLEKKQPVDTLGYDNTYDTWIKNDEYDTIIRALREWKFRGTVKNIWQKTGLSHRRVYATLHWMVDNNKAYKTNDRVTSDTIYYPESGRETRVSYP